MNKHHIFCLVNDMNPEEVATGFTVLFSDTDHKYRFCNRAIKGSKRYLNHYDMGNQQHTTVPASFTKHIFTYPV